jgi:hypothetical protein
MISWCDRCRVSRVAVIRFYVYWRAWRLCVPWAALMDRERAKAA